MRAGYSVDITPATRDGGVDLWVAQQTGLGSFLYAVQCKRHSAERPVRVAMVRELLGTVYTADATAGVLVTSSYFTRDARALSENHRYRISLHDYLSLQRWLASPETWNLSRGTG